MKVNMKQISHRLLRETSGQAFAWAVVAMVALLGMCGFVVDLGHAMLVNRQLQMSTNAAALAGAQDLPNTNYSTVATTYSSHVSTDNNYSNLNFGANPPSVSTSVAGYCSASVVSWGIQCQTIGGTSMNALTVTQQVTIPTYFINVLGINSLTLTSQASAAWKGQARAPYNVAVIVDSTASMNDSDGDASNCGSLSRVACALTGVQTLLANLSPCSPTYTTCPTVSAAWPQANITTPIDEVALYTFPGTSSTTYAQDDADCGTAMTTASNSGDTLTRYGWGVNSASSAASPPTASPAVYYQIVGFSSDYSSKDASNNTSNLISGSYLVQAVGGGGNTCSHNSSGRGGIQDVGGAGTYYAAIVYQAQYDLYQEYSTRLNAGTQSQNVMVVLSDGNATSNATQMGSYTATNTNSSGNFPSFNDECQQAITAAQAATRGTYPSETGGVAVPNTTVYTVAYGAESSGCTTDTSGIEPCDTMRQMASSYVNYGAGSTLQDLDFFSDYTAGTGSSSCVSASNSSTNLNTIFQIIALSLTNSRLIPVGS